MKKSQEKTQGGMEAREVKPKKGYLPEDEIKVEGKLDEKNKLDLKTFQGADVEANQADRKKERLVAKEVPRRQAGEKKNNLVKNLLNKKTNKKGKEREMKEM